MSQQSPAPQPVTSGAVTWTGPGSLSGTTLTVPAGGTTAISVGSDTALNLIDRPTGTHVTITVTPHATLTLNAQVTSGVLNASGGTIRFIGSNAFSGLTTVLDDALTGTGTLNLFGQGGNGELMEVKGAVGSGLTFHLAGTAPDASLQIDNPAQFQGLIDLTSSGIGLGHIAFQGVHATAAYLFSDYLALVNGNTLVDLTRITGRSDLQLHQTASGVMLTAGSVSDIAPASLGTVIPLHQVT